MTQVACNHQVQNRTGVETHQGNCCYRVQVQCAECGAYGWISEARDHVMVEEEVYDADGQYIGRLRYCQNCGAR